MHIAIFQQYYHTPDCPTAARPYALVKRLARDHEVTVVTTRSWRKKRLTNRFPWTPSGVRLVEFDVPYDNSMTTAQRLRSFLEYALRAVWSGTHVPRPDLIVGSSTPLTAALAAATVAFVRDVPWIFEVRDLWPDFPIQMGALPVPGLPALLSSVEKGLYRSATHVVTLSTDMEQHVRTLTPDATVTTIEYGSDLQLVNAISEDQRSTLRRRLSLNDRFLVLYAGALGRANAIPTLLNAAKQLSNHSEVLFAFAGHGYHESTVHEAAQQFDHIRHLSPLPYPDALTLFSVADVSLVSFRDRPVLAANSPGKFYDSLATGTPVIVTNPGWTKRFVQTYDCGWYVPSEAPDALANQLRRLLNTPDRLRETSRNARRAARQHFDRAEIMNRYADLIARVERKTVSNS